MRIAILTTQVPFIFGGAELLANNLRDQLRHAGHEVELVAIPFNWYPTARLRDSIAAASLLDISDFNNMPIDLAIGLKFPAYLANHPNKRFWLVHQHRQAYDMWDAGSSDLLAQEDGALWKGAIDQADRRVLGDRPVFTISANVSRRLRHYSGIDSEPLYHPPPIADMLYKAEPDDYVLVPSRLSVDKRQALVLEALAQTKAPVVAVFVGRPDDRAHGEVLRAQAERLGLSSRVRWLENVPPNHLAALYARSLAVVFVPRNEDYGYVTLEAMLSHKPVVTAADSGGPLEFVSEERGGYVVEPVAASLGQALDSIWTDRVRAAQIGEQGYQRYRELDIGWDRVIARLTDGLADTTRSVSPPETRSRKGTLVEQVAPELLPDNKDVQVRLGLESPEQVLEAYDLQITDSASVLPYIRTHWERYVTTLSLLPRGTALRVLDIGSSPPYVLLALIKLLKPGSTFTIVAEDQPLKEAQQLFYSRRDDSHLIVKLSSFNAEKDRFPFPDGSFDLVLGLEILEHLVLNPIHFFAEAHRVLTLGGDLLVTTPNIVSARSLALAYRGDSPYSFGLFMPHQGTYGRHNREYTPHEVELLGQATGFVTTALHTYNVYGDESEYFDLPLLAGAQYPMGLRGRNIFYRGHRASDANGRMANGSLWRALYNTNPLAIRGELHVHQEEPATLVVVLQNLGSEPWRATGAERVYLRLEVFSSTGLRQGEFFELPLDADLGAGERRKISLPIGHKSGQSAGLMKVHLASPFGTFEHLGIAPVYCVISESATSYLEHKQR